MLAMGMIWSCKWRPAWRNRPLLVPQMTLLMVNPYTFVCRCLLLRKVIHSAATLPTFRAGL